MAAKIGTLNSETGRALKQMALITVDKAPQSHVVEMIWAKEELHSKSLQGETSVIKLLIDVGF